VGIDQADAQCVELSHFDQLANFVKFSDRQLGTCPMPGTGRVWLG
jgi:hypothetical protein